MVLQEDPIVVCKLSQNSRFFPRNRARIFQFEVPIAGILALDSCSLLISLIFGTGDNYITRNNEGPV